MQKAPATVRHRADSTRGSVLPAPAATACEFGARTLQRLAAVANPQVAALSICVCMIWLLLIALAFELTLLPNKSMQSMQIQSVRARRNRFASNCRRSDFLVIAYTTVDILNQTKCDVALLMQTVSDLTVEHITADIDLGQRGLTKVSCCAESAPQLPQQVLQSICVTRKNVLSTN